MKKILFLLLISVSSFAQTRLIRAFWVADEYTNATEATLAATLSGIPTYSSFIYNTDLSKVRYWNGSAFADAPSITANSLPLATTTSQGVIPATGTPSGKFLKDDLSWTAIAGGGDMLRSNNLSDVSSVSTAINNILPSQGSNSGKYLTTNGSVASWGTIAGGGDMLKSDNLSGLADYAIARSNLGLGSLATQSGTFSGTSSGTNTGDAVSTVSVTTANGVSGTVANAGTTPAITLTLGAITPTTVNPTSTITTAAGTTSIAPLNFPSSSVLKTSPSVGDFGFDNKNLYFTPESTSGQSYAPLQQRFRLTSNGSTISTISNFFGTTSNITLVSGAEYLIEIDAYFTNTTSGTVTWTFTNSAAPTSQNIHARFSPVAGIVAPEGSAAATYLEGDIQGDATAAKALTTSGTLTTATTQWAHFSIHLFNSTGTSLLIQATKLVGGTITPLKGSYWTCTRVPSGNTGTFSN